MKKVLFVIAFQGFRDEEYAEPKRILEGHGVGIVTASTAVGTATGKLGLETPVDVPYGDQQAVDYDAVVFIGGPGSPCYWEDPAAHRLLRDAAAAGKIIGGICSAALTLAKAGILSGKRATVWSGDAEAFRPLVGKYTAAECEIDGNCITANGPGAADAFGMALAEALGV
jgi:protease I